MPARALDHTCFWRAPAFGGLELLRGSYRNRAFPRHAHETYVISVMTDGAEEFTHRGVRHSVPAGAIVAMNPGEWHENRGRTDVSFGYRSFYPDRGMISKLVGRRRVRTWFRTSVITNDVPLARRLLRLHRALEQGPASPACEEELVLTFSMLLERHADLDAPPRRPIDASFVGQVQEYLVAHLATQVRLQDLGDLVGRSACHLLRTFRTVTGVTPHQFQNQTRIQRAMALLRAGHPLGAIAHDLGFADQSHFTRHFTRSLGVPPGRFASRVKNVQDVQA